MNRRNIIKSFAMTVLAASTLSGTSATAATTRRSVRPVKGKGLSVGQTRRHDEGLAVTFLAVLDDNRCPVNARCVSAGNAEVLLRVKVGKKKAKIVSLNTAGKVDRHVVISANDFPEGMVGIPESYVISIASLTPGRYAGKRIKQSDYRLKLKITTAV